MSEDEALTYAIEQIRTTRSISEGNLYGRRYSDRTRHPEHAAIQEILTEYDEPIAVLTALQTRLRAEL